MHLEGAKVSTVALSYSCDSLFVYTHIHTVRMLYGLFCEQQGVYLLDGSVVRACVRVVGENISDPALETEYDRNNNTMHLCQRGSFSRALMSSFSATLCYFVCHVASVP